MRWLVVLLFACNPGPWQSKRADRPATRAELEAWPVSVADPILREAMSKAGFNAVARPPYHTELELKAVGNVATLRSDGFFVDEVRGDPAVIADALAHSQRVAEFVRNSGTPQQREMPGGR